MSKKEHWYILNFEIYLHNISCMRRIVVSIRHVVVHLHDRQPIQKGSLVAVQHWAGVEVGHDVDAEVNQRSPLCQILKPEDVEVPVEGRLQQVS